MDATLSLATASIERPSRSAFFSSRKLMRGVAMRPGKIMLQVTPSAPTSRANVFDQATRLDRSAFEIPRLWIGATTPEDVLVMIRPHFRDRILGKTASVTLITDSTMLSKLFVQSVPSWPKAGVGGGPPVLLTRMSTGP